MSRPATVLLTLALALPGRADAQVEAAEDAYSQGVEAFNAGESAKAIALFRRALIGLGEANPLFTSTLYNLGRTALALQKTAPDAVQACEGAAWFGQFLERADRGDARLQGAIADAHAGQAALSRLCAGQRAVEVAPAPPPAQTTTEARSPDHVLAWSLTGGAVAVLGAGVAFNLLARGSLEERDATYKRFQAATNDADAARYEAETRGHEDDASTRATVSYVLLGTGAALAGAATWAWLREPSEPTVAVGLGPAGAAFSVGGRW